MTTFTPIPGVSVLGISGAARHGKDTLALALMRLVPGAERFAFSDAIAAYARITDGMTTRRPRVLQWIGAAQRAKDKAVWLRCLYGAIEDRRPPLAIITGVRFPDEAEMIEAMGGHCIRVVRVEEDGAPFVDPERDPRHEVERYAASLPVRAEIVAKSNDVDTLNRFACLYVGDVLGVALNVP